jgi:mono/diheme cytochrome c family protein
MFAYIGNSIPQISTTQSVGVEIASKLPEELVKAGKAITEGKGGCLICHSIQEDPVARGPSWEGVGARASARKPGMSAAEYLVESLYDPNAFIVEGYPGNQMKPVNRNPIGLTDDEILSVISYLFSWGGDVSPQTVSAIEAAQKPWRTKEITATSGSTQEFSLPKGDPEAGKKAFEEAGCSICHEVPGVKGGESEDYGGPNLTNIADIQSTEYLFESIVHPNAVIAGGTGSGYAGPDGKSQMPEFRDMLTVGQVVDLVAFLETLTGKDE